MKKLTFSLFGLLFFWPFLTEANFTDVPTTSEYYEAVSALEKLEIVEGYEDGTFGVNLPVNRAEFLKMAYLAEAKHHPDRRPWNSSIFDAEEDTLNEEKISTSKLFPFGEKASIKVDPPCFPDLDGKKWLDPYVCWGKEQGLVKGYPDGTFKAIQEVNFAEAAKMLVETSGQFHTDQIDHWAQGYIRSLGDRTVPGSIQSVDEKLTRGQVAQLIYYYTLIPDDVPVENKTFTLFFWNGERFLNLKRLVRESVDSPYYYYAKGEGEVYYSDDRSYESLKKVEGADAETFEKTFIDLPPHYPAAVALDKNHVYSEGKMIEGSAGGSFSLFDDTLFLEKGLTNFYYYAQDDEHIYLLSCYNGGKVSPCYFKGILKDSDPSSFNVLGSLYSKDNQNVYFLDQGLTEADANNFEVVLGFLAKDSKHAYFNGEIVNDVDSSTLQVSPTLYPFQGTSEASEERSFNFAYSSNLLFDTEGEPIAGSAGGKFKLLSDTFLLSSDTSSPYIYAVDSTYAYYISCYYYCEIQLIPESKAESFEILEGRWTKDATNVYFEEKVVSEADPSTFEPLGDGYFRDVDQLFFDGKVMEGVDLETFKVLGDGYSKDINHAYYLHRIIGDISNAPADVNTFERLLPNDEGLYCTLPFSRDSENVFLLNRLLGGLDPDSFEFLDPYGFFFKDDSRIYRVFLEAKGSPCLSPDWTIVSEADHSTFEYLSPYFFKSEGKIYHTTAAGKVTLMEGVDVDSFEVLVTELKDNKALGHSYYAKDKNNAYYNTQILNEIDLPTFEYDYDLGQLKDKNGIYEWSDISQKLSLN